MEPPCFPSPGDIFSLHSRPVCPRQCGEPCFFRQTLVSRKDIEDADWSLSPGHYVGVAPEEPDDDFDFEQTIRDIHTELADLNKEAVELAARIQENFEELAL